MRGALRTLAVAALTAGLLALFLRHADLASVGRGIRAARGDLLLAALVSVAATYAMRAWRWQYLLAPLGPTRFSTAFRTTVIGFAASFLLPARAGEVLRPYLLARRESLSATAAFATIIVERVLDLVAVVLLLGVSLVSWRGTGDPVLLAAVRVGGATAGAVAVVGVALMHGLAGHPERLERWLLRVEWLVPARVARRLASFGRLFAEGLGVMRDPRRLRASVLLSVPLWLGIGLQTWLVTRAFDIALPPLGTFVLLGVLVVGVAVPTPGAVGGFHEAYRLTMTGLFGAANDRAVGAAIVLHALAFVPVTLVGIVFMAQDGLTVGRMRRLAEERRQEGGLG